MRAECVQQARTDLLASATAVRGGSMGSVKEGEVGGGGPQTTNDILTWVGNS